jgi:hypothetical protein
MVLPEHPPRALDYNLPPAPGLIDIKKDGQTIPALAQVGKSGFMFILNRENGTPVHGVDERPTARGDVPGEWYPATQPIPRKPGPIAGVGVTSQGKDGKQYVAVVAATNGQGDNESLLVFALP